MVPIRRNGSAVVELALLLPILMLTFCAVLEFSHVLLMRHSADTAAYEAARSAIVVGASAADAEEAAAELLAAARIRNWEVRVDPVVITEATARVEVTVDIPFRSNAWISPFFFRESVISSSVSLLTERPSNVQLTGLPSQRQTLGINAVGLGL